MNEYSSSDPESPESDDITQGTPSPGRTRRWFIVAGVTMLVLLGGGVAIVKGEALTPGGDAAATSDPSTSESSAGPPEHCQEPTEDTGITEPESSAPDGDVEPVDAGISIGDEGNKAQVGFGTLLQNTSDFVAKDVKVTFSAQNSSGESPIDRWTEQAWETDEFAIPYMLPGTEFGLGDAARFLSDNRDLDFELEVKVEVDEWWAPDNDQHSFHELSADVDDASEQDYPKDRVEFTVDSQFCQAIGEAQAAAVFRDEDGKIIGGFFDGSVMRSVGEARTDQETVDEYQPGVSEDMLIYNFWYMAIADGRADFDTEPDPGQTEVYPYIDK